MPYAYNPTKVDGRAVARENEFRVLQAIRYFGHLRRHEVGLACWPESSRTSAYVMASRTVSRMVKKGMLMEKRNSLGGTTLILASKGVSYLRLKGLTAQEGYELAVDGPQYYHRLLGTCYLLERARLGDEIFGEYAIIRGWSPISRENAKRYFRKVPDGLVVANGTAFGMDASIRMVDWIEIESAYKSYADIEVAFKLFQRSSALNAEGTLILNKLVFVYDPEQGHERRLLRYIRKFLRENPELDPESVMKEIIMVRCFIDLPFAWRGMMEQSVWDIVHGDDYVEPIEDEELDKLDSDEDDADSFYGNK